MKYLFIIPFITHLLLGHPWAQELSISETFQINDNGAWCWFQDERAIVHEGKLLLATVSHSSGAGGNSRNGLMEVSVYDLESQTSEVISMGYIGADDHNGGALLALPSGDVLVVYATHGDDNNMRWRISSNSDFTQWSPVKTQSVGEGLTYSNLFRLSAENNGQGRYYNFHRGIGWNPNFMVSETADDWSYGGRLFSDAGRPYVKYASNNVDEIHFANTDQHPRDYNNSIYHGYFKNGATYTSDGNPLDGNALDGQGMSASDPTRVYQGGADNVAWISDLHLDSAGNPYLAFSVQRGSAGLPTGQGGDDHRYHYGRWTGSEWEVYEIAYAGTRLYSGEDDYTGNIALDPDDPAVVYISTDADPETGTPLTSQADGQRHYELYRGVTDDGGANWEWTALTEDSDEDNIRPAVPKWTADSTALLWVRGVYRSYTNFTTEMMGMLLIEEAPVSVETGILGSGNPPSSGFIWQDGHSFLRVVGRNGEIRLLDLRGKSAHRSHP